MSKRLAYLAGFFDGEGSITLRPGRKTPTITVVQVDRRPLDMFAREFGGRVSARTPPKSASHQQAYRWDLHAGAVQALTDLRPYLIVKADQADRAVALAKTSTSHFARKSDLRLVRMSDNRRARWR